MPVEANRIKGKLRELFPKVNLSTKRLDEISARLAKKATDEADDAAIAQLVNDANDYYSFAEIAKEDDKIRTLEANQKTTESQKEQNQDQSQQQNSNQNQSQKEDESVPAWAKALLTEVQELKQGKVIESKTQAARLEFEKNDIFKSIPEKGKEFYFRQIDVNSETPIAEQIKSLEETHIEITQSKADASSLAGRPPVATKGSAENKKLIDDIVGKK